METETNYPAGLTFDDVLLLPGYSDFSRSEIDLSTKISKHITLQVPLISAPMDTVTDEKLAIALAKANGIGIIHRNLSLADQAEQVRNVRKQNLLVGAAVGASTGYQERVKALADADVSLLVIDSAHGYAKQIIDAIGWIKQNYPIIDIIAGNIATFDAAEALIEAGADGLRVGMGPGAICTTRIISGMGVPQLTAIQETARAAKEKGVPIIADGGINYSGDIVKALAAGASAIMMGSFFASCTESPGETVELRKDEIPHRFKSIFEKNKETYTFKSYRGMGSIGAMEQGAKIKSEDEYHGKSYKDRVLVAEGVEGLVSVRGTVDEMVNQAVGGIRSGFYYVGVKSIAELWAKARFIRITQASLTESHPHDLVITNSGKNY